MVETSNNTEKPINGNKQLHVAVLVFPFGTHGVPMLNLIRRLAIAAPNVTFSFFSTPKSNLSIFGSKSSYQVLSNLKAYDVSDGKPEGYQLVGKPFEDIDFFLSSMVLNFKKAIEEAVESTRIKVSCLMSHGFFDFSADMAEDMGIPWISIWPPGTSSLSAYYYFDHIREVLGVNQNGIAAIERRDQEECIDFIPALSFLHLRDVPRLPLVNPEAPFARMLVKAGKIAPRAYAIVLNTFEELEYPPMLDDLKSKCQNIITLGPFTLPSSNSTSSYHFDSSKYNCIPWLDTQKPTSVAYIAFGTVTPPPPHELTALAEGLEESGVPFLWSLKDNFKVNLPNGFLERTRGRGLVVPWAPQEQVLSHIAVGVYLTHCGWVSVFESITAGVPMIGRPVLADHLQNGTMISDVWKNGIRLKNGIISKEGLVEGLDLIFRSEEGKKIRGRAGALSGLVKHVISPHGSSTKNFNTLMEMISRC